MMITLDQIKVHWLSFLSALGLLSRIPVDWLVRLSNAELTSFHHNRAQLWYPAVGLLIGIILASVFALLPLTFSPFLYAVLLLVLWVFITGALHLDGLADSIDAYVGGMGKGIDEGAKEKRERTLRIMQDPTSGPMAVAGLVLALLLKVALLAELIAYIRPEFGFSVLHASDIGNANMHSLSILILLIPPMLARAWLLPFLWKTDYVRGVSIVKKEFDPRNVQTSGLVTHSGGMATDLAAEFPLPGSAISFGFCQCIALFILGLCGLGLPIWLLISSWLFMNSAAAILLLLIRKLSMDRIGGYTGDVLGAFIELQELLLLFALILLISF